MSIHRRNERYSTCSLCFEHEIDVLEFDPPELGCCDTVRICLKCLKELVEDFDIYEMAQPFGYTDDD